MNPYITYPIIYRHEIAQFAQDVKNQKADRRERKFAKLGITPLRRGANAISILGAIGLVGLNATAFV